MSRRVRLPSWPGTGAAYLAWCAYPSEKPKRDRFFVFAMAGLFDANDVRHRDRPPQLRGKRLEKIVNTVNRGLERITTRRLRAAYLALWELDGEANPSGRFTTRADARELLALAVGGAHSEDDDNFRRRIVDESRPALALAIPLLEATALHARKLLEVIRDEELCAECIARARQWSPALRGKFGPGLIVP